MEVNGKSFEKFIEASEIQAEVNRLAAELDVIYNEEEVTFLVVLKGALLFASDLLRATTLSTTVECCQVASYKGMESTGTFRDILAVDACISNRHVLIIEDIIDSGKTVAYLKEKVQQFNPKSIRVACAFLKPDVFNNAYQVDFVGIEIPNDFVLGYGMDYDGYGRGLKDLYRLAAS